MDTTALADRIRTYVFNVARPVSLSQLKDKTKDICTHIELLDALRQVARYKDIKVTVKDNENWYSVAVIRTQKPPTTRYKPSPELQTKMDAELNDFWEYSPLVTDEERTCYRTRNQNTYKTCNCPTHVWWRFMLMSREERAVIEINRVRLIEKSLCTK